MFKGQSLRVEALQETGVFELCFDRTGEPINKFDARTLRELREAVEMLRAQPGLRGVLVTSAKEAFIVGADITEFSEKFGKPAEWIAESVSRDNGVFVAFEDLGVPSVAAINGFALGGGLEFALSADIRVMSTAAQVGVPEVRLGLFPGLGGTVRLARVAGPALACDWVAGGKAFKAEDARQAGVVDAVASPALLRETALAWLNRAIAGEVDWSARHRRKCLPVAVPDEEAEAIFRQAREKIARNGTPGQPAAAMAIEMMEAANRLPRDDALALESQAFGRVARTQAAASLVQAFLNDQALKKTLKRLQKGTPPVQCVAVIGAGEAAIGIVFASVQKGLRVLWQAESASALAAGVTEVGRLLASQVEEGRLSGERADAALAAIDPTSDIRGLADAEIVLDTVVEDLAAKRGSLAALQSLLPAGGVIACNAAGFSVDEVAGLLERPQDVVGMHFPESAASAPLIELVRASASSDAAIAKAVACALGLGKTPVLVRDGAGSPVDRLRAVYRRAFDRLVASGVDAGRIDQAMDHFGWTVAPATVAGRPQPGHPCEMAAQEMTDSLLLPVIVEAARMLEEGVVGSAAELDTATRLGLTFPAYAGGPLQLADWLGLAEVVARCDGHRDFGPMYEATPSMRRKASKGAGFYAVSPPTDDL